MWEYSYIGDTQNVDAAIRRLRKKIENDPAPVIITTKKEDLDNVSYKFQREIPQAKDRLINTVILIEDTIIYQTIESGATTFYSLDIPSNKVNEFGTIPNYVLDTGATALFDKLLYFYVTIGTEDEKLYNVLYSIDISTSKMEKLSEDDTSAPLLSLYSVPQGILALKIQDKKTCFNLVISEDGPCSKTILEADPDETFVIADVFGDYLYVFAYKNSPTNDEEYDYYINKYLLKDYSKDSTISLASIKSYIENSRIGTMKVMGEYIFFDNYSNICATVVHLLRHMALIGDCDRLVICCNWGNGKVIIRSGCCCYRRSIYLYGAVHQCTAIGEPVMECQIVTILKSKSHSAGM